MIELNRLNGSRFAINPDLVKFVEEAPDTVITLVTGEKLVVRESAHEVIDRILTYRRSLSTVLTSDGEDGEGSDG